MKKSSRKLSAFALRKLEAEKELSRHEGGLHYWLEHVVHWHVLLLAIVSLVTLTYLSANAS